MISKDEFIKKADSIIESWKSKVLPLDYIDNGILLWEAFAFSVYLELLDIDIIIESGVAGGRSTEVWARSFNGNIYGVDNCSVYGKNRLKNTTNRLCKYNNVYIIDNDSYIELPKLIKNNKDKRIALFVDGPKKHLAKDLINTVIDDNVVLVGIHDTCTKNYYRKFSDLNNNIFYSDEKWFLEKYKYLDDARDPYYDDGPGIGIYINDKESLYEFKK